MKENKLVRLYKLFEEQGINVKEIRQLRFYQDEDIDIILNSKYPYIMMNIILNYEFKLLNNNTRKEIINLINNSKTEDIALSIYHIVRSKTILSSGLTYEIAKIIYDSEEVSTTYIKNAALNINVLLNKDVIEILKIIGSSKKEYQASCSSDIAVNIEVLMNGNVLELTKIASQTEGKEQSLIVNAIAKNRDVLLSGMSIKLVKLASKFKLTNSIQMINSIALNKILEKNKRSTYYLIRMLSAETDQDIKKIHDLAEKEISIYQQQESKLKTEDNLFWNLYKDDPQKAISILSIKGTHNITPYTKVRKQ